jgi:hypothetical protein
MRLANQKGRARGVKIDAGVFVFGGMQFISKNKKIRRSSVLCLHRNMARVEFFETSHFHPEAST